MTCHVVYSECASKCKPRIFQRRLPLKTICFGISRNISAPYKALSVTLATPGSLLQLRSQCWSLFQCASFTTLPTEKLYTVSNLTSPRPGRISFFLSRLFSLFVYILVLDIILFDVYHVHLAISLDFLIFTSSSLRPLNETQCIALYSIVLSQTRFINLFGFRDLF